jgi:hypothetical protein
LSGSGQEASFAPLHSFMESLPRHSCRKKSASERRAQRLRAEGRRLQHTLLALHEVHSHRGGRLTRFGVALRAALTTVVRAETSSHDHSSVAVSGVPGVNGIDKATSPRTEFDANDPSFVADCIAAGFDGIGLSSVVAAKAVDVGDIVRAVTFVHDPSSVGASGVAVTYGYEKASRSRTAIEPNVPSFVAGGCAAGVDGSEKSSVTAVQAAGFDGDAGSLGPALVRAESNAQDPSSVAAFRVAVVNGNDMASSARTEICANDPSGVAVRTDPSSAGASWMDVVRASHDGFEMSKEMAVGKETYDVSCALHSCSFLTVRDAARLVPVSSDMCLLVQPLGGEHVLASNGMTEDFDELLTINTPYVYSQSHVTSDPLSN